MRNPDFWRGVPQMAFFGFFLLVMFAAAAAGLVVEVLFLLNLQRLLEAVQPQNRAMTPGLVWLNLVPLFNLGWMIYTVIKIRDSVQRENASRRGATVNEGDTYNVGLAYAIISVAGFVFYFGRYTHWSFSLLSGLISIAALITWIMYWVKTDGLRKQLLRTAGWGYGQAGPYGSGGQYSPGPAAPPAWRPPGPPATQRTCSQCGMKLNPDDLFCASCGTPVPQE